MNDELQIQLEYSSVFFFKKKYFSLKTCEMIGSGLANSVEIYLIKKRTNIIKREKDR